MTILSSWGEPINVSKTPRIILVWTMVDFYILVYYYQSFLGHISCHAYILTFLGRQMRALYCFYFHRKCPEHPE